MRPPPIPQPAVLVVHGAWFHPRTWAAFANALTTAGYLVRCPRLPSCGDTLPPTGDFSSDVHAVRSEVAALQAAGHSILVLAHSYGGMVATEALAPDVLAAAAGAPGVAVLVYLSGWLPCPGQSVLAILGKHGTHGGVMRPDVAPDGTAVLANAAEALYNDLPAAEAARRAHECGVQNMAVMQGAAVHAPWRAVPTTYIFCARDVSIVPTLQGAMVKDVEALGGSIRTRVLDAGHCPFISIPGRVVEVVKDAWKSINS
jgi:pimeloyl-ACP methyl ester carboxylesterase